MGCCTPIFSGATTCDAHANRMPCVARGNAPCKKKRCNRHAVVNTKAKSIASFRVPHPCVAGGIRPSTVAGRAHGVPRIALCVACCDLCCVLRAWICSVCRSSHAGRPDAGSPDTRCLAMCVAGCKRGNCLLVWPFAHRIARCAARRELCCVLHAGACGCWVQRASQVATDPPPW
eukprot:gene15872-biopygen21745